MVLSLVVFVVVSLLAFGVTLRFVDGVAWPAVIGVFCGFAATVLNATDVMARRKGRVPRAARPAPAAVMINGRTAAYLSLVADPGE